MTRGPLGPFRCQAGHGASPTSFRKGLPMTRNAPLRHRVRALSVAVAVGAAAATVVSLAPASEAATCAGYVGLTLTTVPSQETP